MNFLARPRTLLPAAFALSLGIITTLALAQTPTVIKFASVGGITDAPLYLAEEYGLFAKAGLKIEMQRMTSAPNLMTAVATGQLDAAGISITPGLYSDRRAGAVAMTEAAYSRTAPSRP